MLGPFRIDNARLVRIAAAGLTDRFDLDVAIIPYAQYAAVASKRKDDDEENAQWPGYVFSS